MTNCGAERPKIVCCNRACRLDQAGCPRGALIETVVPTKSEAPPFAPIAAPWHTAVMMLVIGTIAFRGWMRADAMRPAVNLDRISLYTRTILSEWMQLGLALGGIWLHGSSPRSALGERWRSARRFFKDIGLGLLFLVASITVTSVLGGQQRTTDSATLFLLPQTNSERAWWIVVALSAGICEEAIFRGYLQRQFMAMTRSVPGGILLSAVAFGAGHAYQGASRAAVIVVLGIMGGILAYWRRSVRPGMIGHALQDLLGGFLRH